MKKHLKDYVGLILLSGIIFTLVAIYSIRNWPAGEQQENDRTQLTLKEQLIGSWVEPIPGMENEVQGFTLNADGTASSVNMATLVYMKWRLENEKLILTAKSIGNRTTSIDDEEYTIDSITIDALYLKAYDRKFIYKRMKNK